MVQRRKETRMGVAQLVLDCRVGTKVQDSNAGSEKCENFNLSNVKNSFFESQ